VRIERQSPLMYKYAIGTQLELRADVSSALRNVYQLSMQIYEFTFIPDLEFLQCALASVILL
jgi:hypothetical protein